MTERVFASLALLIILSASAQAQDNKKALREGNKQYDAGNYKAAEESYRKAIVRKQDYNATFDLGDAQYQQKDYVGAAQRFEKSAELAKDPKQKADAYFNQGNSLLKQNKLDESIEAYKKALRNDPGNRAAQYNLSYAMQKKEQKKKQKQQQNQQNQDKKDQQKNKQDQKDQQNQQQKQPSQPNQQQGQQPQPNPEEISKKEAERMLNAMKKEEENLRKRLYEGNQNQSSDKNKKPW